MGRIDKIFLTRDGKFTVQKGIPSRDPKEPSNEDSALLIGTAYLPPYVFGAKQVKFIKSESKRYTMKDIAKLDGRISNIEFYTSLSLLETDTNSLTIKDPTTGLDRFKSGFYVDNFSTRLTNTSDPSGGVLLIQKIIYADLHIIHHLLICNLVLVLYLVLLVQQHQMQI